MAGLTVVAEMVSMIGAAAKLAAGEIKGATEAVKDYRRAEEEARSSSSSVTKAGGGSDSTMGASFTEALAAEMRR